MQSLFGQMATLRMELEASERARREVEAQRERLEAELQTSRGVLPHHNRPPPGVSSSPSPYATISDGDADEANGGEGGEAGEAAGLGTSSDESDDEDAMPSEFAVVARTPSTHARVGDAGTLQPPPIPAAGTGTDAGTGTGGCAHTTSADAERSARVSLAPQPSEIWYSLVDEEGDIYYWNPSSGITSWEIDPAAIVLPAAPAAPGGAEAPPDAPPHGAPPNGVPFAAREDLNEHTPPEPASVERTPIDETRKPSAAMRLEKEYAVAREMITAEPTAAAPIATGAACDGRCATAMASVSTRVMDDGFDEQRVNESDAGDEEGDEEGDDDELPAEFRMAPPASVPAPAAMPEAMLSDSLTAPATPPATTADMPHPPPLPPAEIHATVSDENGVVPRVAEMAATDLAAQKSSDEEESTATRPPVVQPPATEGSVGVNFPADQALAVAATANGRTSAMPPSAADLDQAEGRDQLAESPSLVWAALDLSGEVEAESEVDERFLTRTLQQLARRERSLSSLRVQLEQAEALLRDLKDGNGARGRRKWQRIAASLRAAITLLAPASQAASMRPSTNPSVETCLVDGWLLLWSGNHDDGSTGQWQRLWFCLRMEGLLYFAGATERVPRGHLAMGLDVDATVLPPMQDAPSPAFCVKTRAHAYAFAVCEDHGSASVEAWIEAFHLVAEMHQERAASQ